MRRHRTVIVKFDPKMTPRIKSEGTLDREVYTFRNESIAERIVRKITEREPNTAIWFGESK